ncbi:MAG: hypothetical protein ACTTI3_05295 [Treponema sp.]
MKKIGIQNYGKKKRRCPSCRYDDRHIFFAFLNIGYSSYAGSLASIKERFPYDAVTRKNLPREVRSLIAAHKNVKETHIIRDLISIKYKDVLCTLEEAEGSMLTRDALIEGRFPRDNTELVISTEFKEKFGITTGDTVSFTIGKRMVRRQGVETEADNERVVPAGEYPAKGEVFRPEGARSFTVTGIFKNPRAVIAANPVVKTQALGDAFKDGQLANIAIVFANKWKAYQTVKDLAALIEPETEDYRTVFLSMICFFPCTERLTAKRFHLRELLR